MDETKSPEMEADKQQEQAELRNPAEKSTQVADSEDGKCFMIKVYLPVSKILSTYPGFIGAC